VLRRHDAPRAGHACHATEISQCPRRHAQAVTFVCAALCDQPLVSVKSVISDEVPTRIGGPQKPVPSLT